ncbi:MAG: 3-oxoacyl-ACP reductase FabG [Nitrososphaerota archaeon]|nr:3-oxoacyl-ACP reductase FabG [Nitrososphaerota archaeon]
MARTDQSRSLERKVALVTAAGRGIGRAIAIELAARGARTMVNSLHRATAGDTASAIAEAGGKAKTMVGDVGIPGVAERLVKATISAFGQLDILVNNAGMTVISPAEEFGLDRWRKTMDTNLNSAFYCSKFAARHMLERRYGRIVNIASVAGVTPFPLRLAYCTSKAALIMMTKGMAIEWAGRGVNVNCVVPGWIETEGVKERIRRKLYSKAPILKRTPMGRMGSPEEVARLVAYVASDESSYMSGSAITMDGGWSSYGYF